MNAIQSWVALPEADEEMDPAFFDHDIGDLPSFEDQGVWGRLIAGEAFGLKAAVKTHSPMFYLHMTLDEGAACELPPNYTERAVYVVSGSLSVDGETAQAGQMLVFKPGDGGTLTAITACVIMMLGGEPIGPRFIDWNFVSSSKDRIEQAKADWRAGRMKLPDLDSEEFIPLPV